MMTIETMCPATREAVVEQEGFGDVGCPLCGRPAMFHEEEEWDTTNRAAGHDDWDES